MICKCKEVIDKCIGILIAEKDELINQDQYAFIKGEYVKTRIHKIDSKIHCLNDLLNNIEEAEKVENSLD